MLKKLQVIAILIGLLVSFPLSLEAYSTSKTVETIHYGSSDLEGPKIVYQAPLSYPQSLLNQEVSGVVILQAQINDKGTIDTIQVIQSSGNAELDAVAVNNLQQYKFSPAYDKTTGKTLPSTFEQKLTFKVARETIQE